MKRSKLWNPSSFKVAKIYSAARMSQVKTKLLLQTIFEPGIDCLENKLFTTFPQT